MRLLLIAILSAPIFALAEPTIKITNFVMNDSTNLRDSTAEVCGTVTDSAKTHEKVIIISDPGRHQAQYVANVAPDGKFCHLIRTITRRATAQTFGHKEDSPQDRQTFSITNTK